MRYIKTFEKYVAMVGTGTRPELAGEIIFKPSGILGESIPEKV